MIELRGITWNHPRGYDPLVRASQRFNEEHPDISIRWKKRSLEEFGDYPVSKLAEMFDLIMIDHPYSGDSLKRNTLVTLNPYISEKHIQYLKTNSVGPSVESYIIEDKIMALACDAAAQVCAYNGNKVSQNDLPKSWDDLIYFASQKKWPFLFVL